MADRVVRNEKAQAVAEAAAVAGAPAAGRGRGEPALECAIRYEHISFSYRKGVPFMEGLAAAIPAGAVTSIVGPNGCGKSTLVKLAAGLLRPTAGRVDVAGRDTGTLAPRERAQLMAVLAQTSHIPPMTVEALVACGRQPYLGWGGRLGADDRAAVEAAMERAGVARFHNMDLRQLSGGERQRAHVARTLAQETDLIVLDEPTTYLDISACHDLMILVRDLNRREGKTVAMVIHDLDLALRYSDFLVVMQRGRVVAQGPADAVLASGVVGDAFHMDICPHDRFCANGRFKEHSDGRLEDRAVSSFGTAAFSHVSVETERGYVLYPRCH